jgi:hypothetical protein
MKYKNNIYQLHSSLSNKMTSKKEYKKLHKEIENIITSRLENILSQLDLSEEDLTHILGLNNQLSNNGSNRRIQSNISGYNLFYREMFPEVKADNPDTQTKDILKIIAGNWKEQNQKTKDDYNKRAKTIKPLTREEKKERQTNNKLIPKTTNKDTKEKQSSKTSSSKLLSSKSSVKSTPAHSDNEQNIKNLLAKLKSPNKHNDK